MKSESTASPDTALSASSSAHSSKVAQLYDKLFSFEVKKATAAYPIHKKLVFSEPQITDIYHWLVQKLPLNEFTHILDAGCGVGFGCQTLAKAGGDKGNTQQLSGISLSPEEVEQASQFAQDADLPQLNFQVMSFEELPKSSYDCVLMVESLKHCSDLDKALQSVSASLRLGGAVFVVEDVYQQANSDKKLSKNLLKQNQQLCEDWHLRKLWDLEDFQQSAAKAGLQLTINSDLTSLMPTQSAVFLQWKLTLFSWLSRVSKSSFFPVYRGGFILDWLYALKMMRYQVLEFRQVETALSEEKAALSEEKAALSEEKEALSQENTALSGEETALSRDKTALSHEQKALSEIKGK